MNKRKPVTSKRIERGFLIGKTWKSEGYSISSKWSGIIYFKFLANSKLITDSEEGKTYILGKWKIINNNILHIEYHLGYPAFKKLQYITERYECKQKQWILQGERCIDGFTSKITQSVKK